MLNVQYVIYDFVSVLSTNIIIDFIMIKIIYPCLKHLRSFYSCIIQFLGGCICLMIVTVI